VSATNRHIKCGGNFPQCLATLVAADHGGTFICVVLPSSANAKRDQVCVGKHALIAEHAPDTETLGDAMDDFGRLLENDGHFSGRVDVGYSVLLCQLSRDVFPERSSEISRPYCRATRRDVLSVSLLVTSKA